MMIIIIIASRKKLDVLIINPVTHCHKFNIRSHELNCILLLDYKFTLSKYDVNNT